MAGNQISIGVIEHEISVDSVTEEAAAAQEICPRATLPLEQVMPKPSGSVMWAKTGTRRLPAASCSASRLVVAIRGSAAQQALCSANALRHCHVVIARRK